MNESSSYPLIIRGPKNSIEIPERFQNIGRLQSLIQKTRQRFSTETFTLGELLDLIGKKDIIDVTQIGDIDLGVFLHGGYTATIQLADKMRWRINCLMGIAGNGYTSIQKHKEKHFGIFHTGSHMPFGEITEQYLIHDPVSTDIIHELLVKQSQQPDPTVWMERTF